ncbi:MAG: hypothetical protein GTN36_01220 [Candidatus Aenigmarchaeota archaeon]|nr:hypothetical protein [Candidatus Aenigmarchaeota archaeon]
MKKKYYLIIVFLIVFIVGLFIHYYFYSSFWGNLINPSKKCETVIEYINGMISGLNSVSIINSSEKLVSNICDVKNSETIESITHYEISSCDLDKIKAGLENPTDLSLDDLRTYIIVSDLHSMKHAFMLLKEIYEREFSEDCNDVRALSAPTYNIIIIGTGALVYTHQQGFLSKCLSEENFTDEEKKECFLSVLDAEKSTTDYYSNLDYTGNIQKCVNLASHDKTFSSLSTSVINSICQKMIEYRKKLLEKVKKTDIDFNQKYFIITSLYIQELYLGKESVSEHLEKNLIERIINPKYQNLFTLG